MIFLSMRGETERYLIDEAINADDKDAESALGPDVVQRDRREGHLVLEGRRVPGRQPVGPPGRADPGEHPPGPRLLPRDQHQRAASSNASAATGPGARGTARPSSSSQIFNDVVFRLWPLDQAIDRFYQAEKDEGQAGSHDVAGRAVKPDPDGVAKFLADNPRDPDPPPARIAA